MHRLLNWFGMHALEKERMAEKQKERKTPGQGTSKDMVRKDLQTCSLTEADDKDWTR